MIPNKMFTTGTTRISLLDLFIKMFSGLVQMIVGTDHPTFCLSRRNPGNMFYNILNIFHLHFKLYRNIRNVLYILNSFLCIFCWYELVCWNSCLCGLIEHVYCKKCPIHRLFHIAKWVASIQIANYKYLNYFSYEDFYVYFVDTISFLSREATVSFPCFSYQLHWSKCFVQ